MDWNVILPFASSALSLVFALMLLDQWRTSRRPYQLVWAIGMLWYGISAGTEWFGGARPGHLAGGDHRQPLASIPGAVKALFGGQLDGRVPATALIALVPLRRTARPDRSAAAVGGDVG